MKILIVFNHPAPYKVALFNGLAEIHDLHVIFERDSASNRNSDFYNEGNYKFKTHHIRGIKLGNENHFSFGVVRHLKKNKYDLIIMNGYSQFTEMFALDYLKRNKIPYAFYINGGIVKKETKLKRKIKTHFIRGASFYFSPAVKANEYLIHYGAPEDKIMLYPYSTVYEKDIITARISSSGKQSFWQQHNVGGSNFTICVTSFIKRKNNFCLIKAWKNIDQNNTLILVGEGPEEKMYRKYIEENKITNVYLLPFAKKNKIFEYLKHSNNAIYLSNYDIYGHVINEALAHGLNVLTNTNMVAAFNLIKNNVNGLIHLPEEDLLTKINELFTKDFFEQARTSAHTIEQSIKVHLDHLEEIL